MVAIIRWCCNNIESGDKSESWKNAVPALKQLLKDLASRSLFLQNDGVKSIVSLLNRLKGEKNEGISANPQWIYELSFILWATTLSATNKAELAYFNTSGIVSTLVLLLANSPSRKITRVSVAALNNLAASQDSEILAQMLSANLERVLGNLTNSAIAKHSNDPEFDSDLAQLTENINKNFKDLSSFERWVAEVNSGTLRWGATHTEKFWRENYKAIEQGDFANLKKIIALINSEDPVVVSVALNDIGEISRFYPNGRLIVARLGGKDAAMAKLSASGNAKVDPNVERYALQCVSKIMVENWENIK
jgi:V-type H+-transporting ATPase subunit H